MKKSFPHGKLFLFTRLCRNSCRRQFTTARSIHARSAIHFPPPLRICCQENRPLDNPESCRGRRPRRPVADYPLTLRRHLIRLRSRCGTFPSRGRLFSSASLNRTTLPRPFTRLSRNSFMQNNLHDLKYGFPFFFRASFQQILYFLFCRNL